MSWLTVKVLGYTSLALLAVCIALGGTLLLTRANARADAAQAAKDFASHLALDAEAEARAQQAARDTEQRHARELNEIAARYEQDKRDAQAKADAVVADLRSGNLRLRREWQGCETNSLSRAAASASQPNDRADDRERLASLVVRAGAECDARVKALQDVLRKERE